MRRRDPSVVSKAASEIGRGIWRLSQGLFAFTLLSYHQIPTRFYKYFRDSRRFRKLKRTANFAELAPCLFDADSDSQSGGWATTSIRTFGPSDTSPRFDLQCTVMSGPGLMALLHKQRVSPQLCTGTFGCRASICPNLSSGKAVF